MKRKSTVLALSSLSSLSSLVTLAALALSGCYASEKIGKDIQNVSHDVNQGGIYMHRGALSVYRPERPAPSPALTNASLPATAPAALAPAPATSPTAGEPMPMATPEWQPPADGSEALPKKDAPAAAPAPAPAAAPPASDAGVYSM